MEERGAKGDGSASLEDAINVETIREATARARASALKWLEYRSQMDAAVADYEASRVAGSSAPEGLQPRRTRS